METGIKEASTHDTEHLLIRLGNPGRFQVLLFILLSTQYFPVAMNDLMPLFYSVLPTEVRCKDWDLEEIGNSTNVGRRLNGTLTASNHSADLCSTPCPSGYIYYYPDRQWSIIADMDLICGKEALVNVASTIYFLGSLLGGLFWGEIADKYGRRKTLLITNIIYSICSGGTIFSRDYISFVILRFLTGFAIQGMASTFYVVIMEWIPSSRRGFFATVCQFFFTLAGISLSVGAYFLQNWRLIQIVLAVSNAAAVTYFWFAPEPLQWLLLNNQVDQARIIWRQIAEFNKVELSMEDIKELEAIKTKQITKTYGMLDCFRTPGIRKKTLLASFAWFATFISYLGLSFVITDIAPNLYHNLIIGSVIELIPCAMAALLVAKYGAKNPLLAYFVAGGVLSIIVGLLPTSTFILIMTKNVFAVLARMCLLGCLSTVSFFTVELFPTVIRNSAFGICAAAMHIGGMLSHEIFFLENLTSFKGLPIVILGVIALLGAVATFFLPQTTGKLPDTIEEAEAMDTESVTSSLLRKRKPVHLQNPTGRRVSFTNFKS